MVYFADMGKYEQYMQGVEKPYSSHVLGNDLSPLDSCYGADSGDNFAKLPLPRADLTPLIKLDAWRRGQGGCAADLARAAMSVGRLDELVGTMEAGAITRLALVEAEELLWAAGTPVSADDLGRDLIEARSSTDLAALQQGRWALRRLEGHGELTDLRGFLALYRKTAEEPDNYSGSLPGVMPRLQGAEFDAAAEEFLQAMAAGVDLHPIVRGAYSRALWAVADLSPDGAAVEGPVWSARAMAAECAALLFVPLGRIRRRSWSYTGTPAEHLRSHCAAVEAASAAAHARLRQVQRWGERARQLTAKIKGDNPARIIAVLLTHPQALTATVATEAGISRDTAERLLVRMCDMNIVREVTGARRFRLWAAATART